jgi:hypothetical protein
VVQIKQVVLELLGKVMLVVMDSPLVNQVLMVKQVEVVEQVPQELLLHLHWQVQVVLEAILTPLGELQQQLV